MRFALGSLALPGFLDVLGRQPPHRGVVLVVRPELGGLTLAVQPRPQVSGGTVEVMLLRHQMPATRTAAVNQRSSELEDQESLWLGTRQFSLN